MDMMHDSQLATMHDVAVYIAEAECADLAGEHTAQEQACAACETTADWQDCIDSFGARVVGSFVADWCDGAEYHPCESSGLAYLDIGDGNSLVAYWPNDGRWTVDIETEARARMAAEDIARDWRDDETEADDETEESGQ